MIEFSLTGFEFLLRLLIKKEFEFVTEYEENETIASSNKILLRHDIDFDYHSALRMASKESEYGVKAVYLLRIENNLINFLSSSSIEITRKIIEMGHVVGLHIEHNVTKMGIEQSLEVLQSITQKPITHISFHKPTKSMLPKLPLQVAQDLNSMIYTKKVKYLSDSGMKWREDILGALDKYTRIHLLIHPEFWTSNSTNYVDVLKDLEQKLNENIKNEISEEISDIQKSIASRMKIDDEILENMWNRE